MPREQFEFDFNKKNQEYKIDQKHLDSIIDEAIAQIEEDTKLSKKDAVKRALDLNKIYSETDQAKYFHYLAAALEKLPARLKKEVPDLFGDKPEIENLSRGHKSTKIN